MKKTVLIASSLVLAGTLAACNKQPEAAKPAESAAANTGKMSEMAMPTEMKHGKGVGTVTAIGPAKGTVTLDHGDIAELKWPAMEMGFSAKPEVLEGVKVGDKVAFEIDWDGKGGTVTSITKAGGS